MAVKLVTTEFQGYLTLLPSYWFSNASAVIITSGQSNLTKGRISATHGWFNAILAGGASVPTNRCFLGSTQVQIPNGIWIGSAVLHSSRQSHYTLQCAVPFPPIKLPLPMGEYIFPWAHPSPQPKQHLNPFNHFCRAHSCDRPIDHATRLVTIGRIYVHNTAMRPNNTIIQ